MTSMLIMNFRNIDERDHLILLFHYCLMKTLILWSLIPNTYVHCIHVFIIMALLWFNQFHMFLVLTGYQFKYKVFEKMILNSVYIPSCLINRPIFHFQYFILIGFFMLNVQFIGPCLTFHYLTCHVIYNWIIT